MVLVGCGGGDAAPPAPGPAAYVPDSNNTEAMLNPVQPAAEQDAAPDPEATQEEDPAPDVEPTSDAEPVTPEDDPAPDEEPTPDEEPMPEGDPTSEGEPDPDEEPAAPPEPGWVQVLLDVRGHAGMRVMGSLLDEGIPIAGFCEDVPEDDFRQLVTLTEVSAKDPCDLGDPVEIQPGIYRLELHVRDPETNRSVACTRRWVEVDGDRLIDAPLFTEFCE